MNEQERYRDFIHANVDDKTLHELYLWPFADAVRAGVGSVMSYVFSIVPSMFILIPQVL